MSVHPYRQKVATAPYPVYDDAPSDNSGSESGFADTSGSVPAVPRVPSVPMVPSDSLVPSVPSVPSIRSVPSIPSLPSVDSSNSTHVPLDQKLQISNRICEAASPLFSGRNPLTAVVSPPVPYPYDSSDMPHKDLTMTPPGSNPLSALSSVTNLNLNSTDPHASDLLYSKSENNLPGLLGTKYAHTRLVSLTLSFFHDRDNSSLIDFNQSVIHQYLGSNLSHLMPRMKTIEMYRKNAKKSNDPAVLFQYAQYMLQTALMLDTVTPAGSGTSTPRATPTKSSPSLDVTDKSHRKSRLVNSLSLENITLLDPQLKRSLLKEAQYYLKRLADKGYVDAQYLLGDAYSSGALGKVDNKEAFSLFLLAAKHGHAECAFRTAHCYEEGLGTGRDARKGVEFLKTAASRNHPAAMYKLGMYMFYSRMGLPGNVTTKQMGIKWLERALNVATELTAAAPYELGRIYQEGFLDILLKDEKYALELYAQAAALGHVESAAILGRCYEIGDVVPQDPNLSIHYYTKAALGGNPEAMLAMCAWYLVGSEPNLPKDDLEAFEWAKRAANCGLPKAQFAVANFYDKGIGCIKNTAEAQQWYKKAAENGEEKALARITNKEVVAKLSKVVTKKKSQPLAVSSKTAAQEKDCVIM